MQAVAGRTSGLSAYVERHQALLAALVSVCVLLLLQKSYGINEVLYDGKDYWFLAHPDYFGQVKTHRGYFFPALLLPLHLLAGATGLDPLLVLKLGLSLGYGVALPLVVPAAFTTAFGGKVTFWRRLIPVALMAQFFPGLLLYPLSDLTALLLLLGGLLCVLRSTRAPSKQRFAGALFLAGLLIAAAYNTRTIYLFALFGTAAIIGLKLGFAREMAYPRWIALVAFGAGAFALSLPQFAVNKRTHGKSSLAVIAIVGDYSLFASQMAWGMTLQRYETTAPGVAPTPGVYYLDPAGEEIFNREVKERNPFLLRNYISIVLRHPLDFLALYARHALNGLDLRDGLVYVRKSSPSRDRTAVANFCVLALACWLIFAVRKYRPCDPDFARPRQGWPYALLMLLFPVMAILPGAIETRFFAPVHLLAYAVIAFYFHLPALRASSRTDGVRIAAATAVAASIFFGVTMATMANQESVWPRLYQFGPPR